MKQYVQPIVKHLPMILDGDDEITFEDNRYELVFPAILSILSIPTN